MKTSTTLWLSLITALAGIFFFAVKHEFIIMRLPGYHYNLLHDPSTTATQKKMITLYVRSRDTWRTERQELLVTNDTAENMRLIVTSWLNFVQDEHNIEKKVAVQSCALSASGQEMYISFDRNPLPKEQPIIAKWLLIEGLLKTIRENKIPLVSIHFLVHHQPLQDPHLSFDLPWPVNGFFE